MAIEVIFTENAYNPRNTCTGENRNYKETAALTTHVVRQEIFLVCLVRNLRHLSSYVVSLLGKSGRIVQLSSYIRCQLIGRYVAYNTWDHTQMLQHFLLINKYTSFHLNYFHIITYTVLSYRN